MAKKVKVLAGDFLEYGEWDHGAFKFRTKATQLTPNELPASTLESIEVATEENVKRVGGTAGWAAAGMVFLGPIGLLGGLLLGGKGKDVTFVAEFKDGRKFMATVDQKVYIEILAAKGL